MNESLFLSPGIRALMAMVLAVLLWSSIGGSSEAQTGCSPNPNGVVWGTDGANFFYDGYGYETTWHGKAGDDFAEMRDCRDQAYGGLNTDEIHGAYGNDYVDGKEGYDKGFNWYDAKLFGGADHDTIVGGDGEDALDDRAQGDADLLYGENGNDHLDSYDLDNNDQVDCGPPPGPTEGATSDSGDSRVDC